MQIIKQENVYLNVVQIILHYKLIQRHGYVYNFVHHHISLKIQQPHTQVVVYLNVHLYMNINLLDHVNHIVHNHILLI